VLLAVAAETVYLVALYATDGYDVARTGELTRLVLSYGALVALFLVPHLALGGTRSRRGLVATTVLYVLFILISFARFETAGSFDYSFLAENVAELATPLGRHIVGSQVKPVEIALLLALPLLVGGYALLRRRSPPWFVEDAGRRRWALVLALATILGPPLLHFGTHEPLSTFAVSAIRYHVAESRAEASTGEGYPFVQPFVPSPEARAVGGGPAPRPHVIVLLLESWSGLYTDRKRPDGAPTTPVFDARRRGALTFDHFYGNSIQSSRGRFAALCSQVPLYRGKEFRDLGGTTLRCLPHVLADRGYRTMILSASDEPFFERSTTFFAQLGFGDVRFEDPAARATNPLVWGAGLRDDVYYRRFFGALDERVAAEPDRPLFAVAINASHHYPFNREPGHVPAPGFRTRYQRDYVSSLTAQDARLAVFFEELERRPAFRDAIVVLVGDHSFPADEHGIHFNGLGGYEESFRTAFMLQWKGHVPPQVDSRRTASQLDLAPTVADLLQLEEPLPFRGRSLIAPDREGDPRAVALMVQPYDGVRMVAVRWPYKLERHDAADQEHLYDLATDPDEARDRFDDPTLAGPRAELLAGIVRIRTSQSILLGGKVWPPPPPSPKSPP